MSRPTPERKKRFYVWNGILLIVLAAAFSGCRNNAPVILGVLAPLSGNQAETGDLARKGILLAVEEINSDGGIDGRRVELIYNDTEGTPEGALAGARELVQYKVAAVIGPYLSTSAEAILDYINQNDILFLSPTASSAQLEKLDDNLFRLVRSATSRSFLYAHRIAEYYRYKRVSVIRDSSNPIYTGEWSSAYSKRFCELGGNILHDVPFRAEENQLLTPVVEEALDGAPEAVVLVTDSLTTALLCQQIRKFDPAIPIFSSEWAGLGGSLITLGGEAVEGVEILKSMNPDSINPLYERYKIMYSERYGDREEVNGYHSYEAATIIFRSLREKREKESLKEAVLRIKDFESLRGDVSFDQYGDSNLTYLFYTVTDGGYSRSEGQE